MRTNGGGRRPDRGEVEWKGEGINRGGGALAAWRAQWEEDYPMPGLVAAAAAQAAAVRSGGSVRREGAEQQQAAEVALLDPSKKEKAGGASRFLFFLKILYCKGRRDILRDEARTAAVNLRADSGGEKMSLSACIKPV